MAITGNLDIPGGNILPAMPQVSSLADFVKADPLPDKAQKMFSRPYKLIPNFMIVPQPIVIQAIFKQALSGTGHGRPVHQPLISYCQARETYKALMGLDFLVVSDIFMTPTAALADIVLPAATGFEFDDIGHYRFSPGLDFIPSEDCRSSGRKLAGHQDPKRARPGLGT